MKNLFAWILGFFPKYVVPVSDKASGHSYSMDYIKAHPEEFSADVYKTALEAPKGPKPKVRRCAPLNEIYAFLEEILAVRKTYCIDMLAKVNHSDYANIDEQITNLKASEKFFIDSGFERSKEVSVIRNQIHELEQLKRAKEIGPDLLYLIDYVADKGLIFIPIQSVYTFLLEYNLNIVPSGYFRNIDENQVKEVLAKKLDLNPIFVKQVMHRFRDCHDTNFSTDKELVKTLPLCVTKLDFDYDGRHQKLQYINHSFILQPVSYNSAMGFVVLLTIEHEQIQ